MSSAVSRHRTQKNNKWWLRDIFQVFIKIFAFVGMHLPPLQNFFVGDLVAMSCPPLKNFSRPPKFDLVEFLPIFIFLEKIFLGLKIDFKISFKNEILNYDNSIIICNLIQWYFIYFLKSIFRPRKIISRKIKIGKNSTRSNLGGLIKNFFKFSKITLGDRTCGPKLLNLTDRTKSLITGVGKFL